MFKTISFPSVVELNNFELKKVADSLINGLKLINTDASYIIGELAMAEGSSPHKSVNSAPSDTDYQLLLQASLLLAYNQLQSAFYVTAGFPFITYQLYRNEAVNVIQQNHNIQFDASTCTNFGQSQVNVNVIKAFILSEIQGCDIAIRKGEIGEKSNFFIVSLGYGTFEAALSTENGVIQRTFVSSQGIRYAVNMLARELLQSYYVGLMTEHQFDMGFKTGSLVLNRKRIDITEFRKKALINYYREVISPMLKKSFTDNDYNICRKLYLVGGGALFPEIVDCFNKEFKDLLEIAIYPQPTTCASIGYCINSKEAITEKNVAAVGIDIGNSTTTISYYEGK
jgi:plasmid segregation protein ParM